MGTNSKFHLKLNFLASYFWLEGCKEVGTEGGKAVVTFSLVLHFPAAASDTFWRGGRWGKLSWLEQVPQRLVFSGYCRYLKLILSGHFCGLAALHAGFSRLGGYSWFSFQALLRAPWGFSSIGTTPHTPLQLLRRQHGLH